MLSDKGCLIAKTARMLAQKQPSFKECVKAHWSSDFAPKMIGTKHTTEATAPIKTYRRVGEHSIGIEGVS